MTVAEHSPLDEALQQVLAQLRASNAAIAQEVAQLRAANAALAEDADKTLPESTNLADNSDIQRVEEQLRALTAKAAAMEAEATKLAQESNGSASTEAEHARSQAADMRSAATQAQSVIASAPTDSRTGRKRISAAKLGGISSVVEHMTTEAEHETAELSSAIVEVRAYKSKRATTLSAPARPTMAARVNAALVGSNASDEASRDPRRYGEDSPHDDDDDKTYRLMNPIELRNHDRTVSGREAAIGTVSLVRAAIGSRRKRATAAKIANEISDAAKRDDRRDMLDGSLHVGRGVARTTGSEDLGHLATTVVGNTVTKTNTAGDLASQGRVGDWVSAAVRNVHGGISAIGDLTQLSGITNAIGIRSLTRGQLKPFMMALMTDKEYDWERLVNKRNEKQFDTDGNGRIDADEIIGVLRNNAVTFGRLDTDHDGKIELQELRAQLIVIAHKNKAHVEGRPTPVNAPPPAQMVTLDGHGKIAVDAARSILKSSQIRIDVNRDGVETQAEIMAGIQHWNATHADNGQMLAALPAHSAGKAVAVRSGT